MRILLSLGLTAIVAATASAAVKTQDVTYTLDGVNFKGQIAYDDEVKGKRPGVLVVHEWWGLDDYARKRAADLAKLGYVAFACDMYGEGKQAKHPEDAMKFAGEVRKNVEAWQGRAKAALKVLAEHEMVDPTKLAAIGYCFGGSTCLQLAYSGADLKAVATFHAALPTPTPEQAKAIKAKILIAHGADDPFIKAETIAAFRAALDKAKVSYQFEQYPGAVHSFTVPGADEHKIKGMAYNKEADEKSWQAMRALFDEAFAKK